MNTSAKRALYTNLGDDEDLALAVDATIRKTKQDNWRGSKIKERAILYEIQEVLHDDKDLAARIFDLAKNQDEY